MNQTADVIILGAGPAGCCAAIRLADLGKRVILAERTAFPRPHIGESLSPGIWNILDYLGVAENIAEGQILRDLTARVIWESREPSVIPAEKRGPGVMVDRADFDHRLLEAARQRGVRILQPARVLTRVRDEDGWALAVQYNGEIIEVKAHLVLDAMGRHGKSARSRHATAPVTLALWDAAPGSWMPRETRIEALPRGWLWGSPRPDGSYRVMAFVSPCKVRILGATETMRRLLAQSRLFKPAAESVSHPRTCSAAPYLDMTPWDEGCIKLGEAAFALDPLSSSGVEKAMRFAMQTVIAVNTVLADPDALPMAREFYESRFLEAVATHTVWTRNYYAQAWPGGDEVFWREHAEEPERKAPWPAMIQRFNEACTRRRRLEEAPVATQPREDANVLWRLPVQPSPYLRFVTTPCVVGDIIQPRSAIMHPHLDRPLAYLAGHEIAPLLRPVLGRTTLGSLVREWSTRIPGETAARIAGWLHQKGLLVPLP